MKELTEFVVFMYSFWKKKLHHLFLEQKLGPSHQYQMIYTLVHCPFAVELLP